MRKPALVPLPMVLAAVLLAAGLPPVLAEPAPPGLGWTVDVVAPSDRPELVLHVTKVDPAAGVLTLTVVGDGLKGSAARRTVSDPGPAEVRLGPFDRSYGPATLRTEANGTTHEQTVFVGALEAHGPELLRAGDLRSWGSGPPARGEPQATPVAPGGTATVPPLANGQEAPDGALVILVHHSGTPIDAAFAAAFLDEAGAVIGRAAGTTTRLGGERSALDPALIAPDGTDRIAVEVLFDGGAVRAGIRPMPPPVDVVDRSYDPPDPAAAWMALLLGAFAVTVGAGVGTWAARRPGPAPRVHQ